MLVLANQTIVGQPLLDAIRSGRRSRRRTSRSSRPPTSPAPSAVLDVALRSLREAGVDASGHLGDPDPYTAAVNACATSRSTS